MLARNSLLAVLACSALHGFAEVVVYDAGAVEGLTPDAHTGSCSDDHEMDEEEDAQFGALRGRDFGDPAVGGEVDAEDGVDVPVLVEDGGVRADPGAPPVGVDLVGEGVFAVHGALLGFLGFAEGFSDRGAGLAFAVVDAVAVVVGLGIDDETALAVDDAEGVDVGDGGVGAQPADLGLDEFEEYRVVGGCVEVDGRCASSLEFVGVGRGEADDLGTELFADGFTAPHRQNEAAADDGYGREQEHEAGGRARAAALHRVPRDRGRAERGDDEHGDLNVLDHDKAIPGWPPGVNSRVSNEIGGGWGAG
ncbi:MAG: hypothetical protein ACFHWZ_05515 [Phycisphaerales bacterium]